MRTPQGRFISATLLAASLVFVAACVSGPPFKKVETIPEGSALVYVYRPDHFAGSIVSFDVSAGKNLVSWIGNGSYYPYIASPGEIEFWAKTESKASVTLDVKAGETYYVRASVSIGAFVGRPFLEIVTTQVGEDEIRECKLVIPEKQHK